MCFPISLQYLYYECGFMQIIVLLNNILFDLFLDIG